MLARQQRLNLVLREHRGEKLRRHIAFEQPVAVFGEGGGVPYRVLNAETDKPAEQQVMINCVVFQKSSITDRTVKLR